MAVWGEEMPDAFPTGSNSVGADPAIWENFSDFENKADAFAKAAAFERGCRFRQCRCG